MTTTTGISDQASAPARKAPPERLLDRLADFLARVSPDGRIQFVSAQGLAWLGYEADALGKGDPLADLLAPEDREPVRQALLQAHGHARLALSVRLLRRDGTPVRVLCRVLGLAGADAHAECLFAAWGLAEGGEAAATADAAEGLATSGGAQDAGPAPDALTGLPTRAWLMARLAELTRPGAPGPGFALLHLDLDGFHKVNDAMGHDAGDRLLVETAGRLKAVLRTSDQVIRSGSDEFALLLPGAGDEETVLPVARKLMAALQRPFALGAGQAHLSASIGIALYPEHARDGTQLFKCADVALSAAKREGRRRWCVYRHEGGAALNRRVALEEALYEAIQNGEFEMHFQPIFRAETREMAAVEALMRWNRPGEGYVSPAEFIPLAESNGLIGFLGAWSLRASCHQVARWNAAWGARLRASVNLSPLQFRGGEMLAKVRDALAESGLAPDCLTLEITEGALMHDPAEAETLLQALRALGAGVSVDDFGTGYSSLAYLKRFPLSTLKIDRSFVQDLERDANDHAIVSAILGLAHALGLKVVAEGVETEAQFAILTGKGCDLIQGYLLGRPVGARVLQDKVEAGEWRLAR